MEEVPEVEEVEPPVRCRENMNWDINERKEQLFSQIIVAGVKAFLTNSANVKPDARGRGGQTYEKKLIWENPTDGIITMLKKSEAFNDAASDACIAVGLGRPFWFLRCRRLTMMW